MKRNNYMLKGISCCYEHEALCVSNQIQRVQQARVVPLHRKRIEC